MVSYLSQTNLKSQGQGVLLSQGAVHSVSLSDISDSFFKALKESYNNMMEVQT